MHTIGTDVSDTLTALVRCRQMVLERATTLLHPRESLPLVEQFDALPNVSALLLTSLEELKVAEEELRQQNEELASQRAAVDRVARHYRDLFRHGPLPAFVTDSYATIHEVNYAAARVFRREASLLEGKPLAVMLPLEHRESFRRQLSFIPADGVRDWRLVLRRVGDLPIEVSAAVQRVPEGGITGSAALHWVFRLADDHATDHGG